MVTLRELANSLDASDMLGNIRNFPSDLAAAWEKSESWGLANLETQTFTGVICLGMGGSASGGDFLSCLSSSAFLLFISSRLGLPVGVPLPSLSFSITSPAMII